jgi:hypothetical protein
LNDIIEHKFEIGFTDFGIFKTFVSNLGHINPNLPNVVDLQDIGITPEKVCIIENYFEYDEDSVIEEILGYKTFNETLIGNYLISLLRLLRLFKDGNICMPYCFYVSCVDGKYNNYGLPGIEKWVFNEIYTINDSELGDLKEFIQNTTLDFQERSLKLAFENFELSYEVKDLNLQFLTLMTSMEVLFNPGNDVTNKKHIISDNCAKLIGKDSSDLGEIYSEMKEFYGKRSDLVHEGSYDISRKDVLNLRFYVRESIKKANKAGMNKKDLLKSLKNWNFKKGPWQTI